MKAVVIEDEIRIREGLCRLMEKIFPEIELSATAENGLEGLALIERYRPDLVITDIKMPGMDGLEMLSEAQSRGLFPKVIVLTAYSEFSFAQQAVRLGVHDYLVKPISVQDFTQTVRKVQALWEREQRRAPEAMASLENIVSRLLHSDSAPERDEEVFLKNRYGLHRNDPLLLLPVCLDGEFQARRGIVRKNLEGLLRQRDGLRYCLTDIEYDRTILALVYGYGSREDFESWYAGQVRRQSGENLVCGIIEAENLRGIHGSYQLITGWLDWDISLGSGALISYPKIRSAETGVCVYPMELENQMKAAVCVGEAPRIHKTVERFQDHMTSGSYAPGEIKDCCIRFLWAFLNVAEEVGCIDSGGIDQRDILNQVMDAKTLNQLFRPFEELFSRIHNVPEKDDGASLAVKRAKSMIHEFYADGITLGEIADRLNMSQEYLGTQFHREVGESFSIYIRSVRMAKAKELLIGTQLKQYEIAARVGYSDAKYFARVFRECEGMSPAEYRKTYR